MDILTLYSVLLLALEIYSDKSSDCGRAGDSAVLMTVWGYLITFTHPLPPPRRNYPQFRSDLGGAWAGAGCKISQHSAPPVRHILPALDTSGDQPGGASTGKKKMSIKISIFPTFL